MSKINFIFNKGLTNEIVKNNIFMTTRDNISDPSTNILDSSLNTYVRTLTGIGEQVDVSLNTPIDLSNIQAIVAFPKSVLSKNPTVGKIRYEIDNSNTQFQLDEIQMWVDNSNILPLQGVSFSTPSPNNSIVHLNNKNLTSGKFSSLYLANYIDIDISTKSVKFNDIQSIVTYNYNTDVSNLDLSNQEATKIILYDCLDIVINKSQL